MNKVFIQPIHYESESIDQERPNVRLRVKNTASLDEFIGETYLNPQYLEKVQRWVRKNKFSCTALNNDLEMELKVEIFKFQLQKQSKGDIETLKQDIATMRKENAQLKGQMKLFRYYFLNLWRDKQHRNAIAEKPDFRQELV